MTKAAITAAEIRKVLEEEGCDTIRIQARIATNNMQCTVCRGAKETTVKLAQGHHTEECWEQALEKCDCGAVKHGKKCMRNDPGLCGCLGVSKRECQSCNGTGLEPIDPKLIAQVCAALDAKLIPDLKQVDNTSSDGSQQQGYRVVVFDQPKLQPGSAKIPPAIHARRDD